MGFLDFVGVNGEVRSGEGMLASPNPGSVLPPGAMQASPPRSTPPPPLRERMRLKTLHTGIHAKPTRASRLRSPLEGERLRDAACSATFSTITQKGQEGG